MIGVGGAPCPGGLTRGFGTGAQKGKHGECVGARLDIDSGSTYGGGGGQTAQVHSDSLG